MTQANADLRLTRREWLSAAAVAAASGCVSTGAPPRSELMRRSNVLYDVVIVGGGPAGLSGALALGRARKRVLLCDSGPRRNAAAAHVHNFVTQDGTPPEEMRRVARQQLARYPNVEIRDDRVQSVGGARGAFRLEVGADLAEARRVLLCTGMIDEPLALPGFREHWGRAIFQCPYCHGWEVQDRRWGYLVLPATSSHLLPFAIQARAWTREVVVFTSGAVAVPDEARAQLEAAGVKLETAPVVGLLGDGERLEAVELEGGRRVPCEALFAHPPQRQVDLVRSLGLGLDEEGFVRVDPMKRETSVPGIYAAGDSTSRMQAAIVAAGAGMQAGAMINVELTMELALAGAL